MISAPRATGWLGCAAALVGCVGPLTDDAVPAKTLAYANLGDVPAADDATLARIDAADGVGRLIERRSAFYGGKRILYWDFGPASADVLPLYALVRVAADGTATPVAEHPYLVDSIPGDAGYTPFWTVWYVPVTDAWQGDPIASVAELQIAQGQGLVGEPFEAGVLGNCPIVHRDVRLVAKGDPAQPPGIAFYRGMAVPVYAMGFFKPGDDGATPVSDVVQVRRVGGEPVDEEARGVDITGDGDTNDSNNLFRLGEGETPLWRVVTVAVAADRSLIDDAQDEKVSTVTDFTALFVDAPWPELTPVPGQLQALQATELLVNCPIEPVAP